MRTLGIIICWLFLSGRRIKDFFLVFKAKGSLIHWTSGAEGIRRRSDLAKLLVKQKKEGSNLALKKFTPVEGHQ